MTLAKPRLTQHDNLLSLFITPRQVRFFLLGIVRELRVRHFAQDGLQTEPLHEHGVGYTDLDTDTLEEGEVSRFNVARAPAEKHRVECDDQRCEPVRFGTLEKRKHYLVCAGPMEEISGWDKREVDSGGNVLPV